MPSAAAAQSTLLCFTLFGVRESNHFSIHYTEKLWTCASSMKQNWGNW